MPLTCISFLILFARVFKADLNKYGDSGHLCLTPV